MMMLKNRKITWMSLMACLLILTSCEVTTGTGGITGFVNETYMDATSGLVLTNGVSGVTIYYSDGIQASPAPGASIREIKSVTTDSRGYFEIFGLPLGTYTLEYEMAGYLTTTRQIDLGVTTGSIGSTGASMTQSTLVADGSIALGRNFALSDWSGKYANAKLQPSGNLILTFSENIDRVVSVSDHNGTGVLDNATITIAGNVVTVDPVRELAAGVSLALYWKVQAGGIQRDNDGNWNTVLVSGMTRISSSIDTQSAGDSTEVYATDIIPSITFSDTIDSFDATTTSLKVYRSSTFLWYPVDTTISVSGATITLTPAAVLDPDSSYAVTYKVSSALNRGQDTATGTLYFSTQDSVAAIPGSVTGLAVHTGHNYNSTTFTYQFDRIAGATAYNLYARITGSNEAKLLQTVNEVATNATFLAPTVSIGSGVFGSGYPLANGQSLDFYMTAVNKDGIEGASSSAVTGVRDDTNYMATLPFTMVLVQDNLTSSTVTRDFQLTLPEPSKAIISGVSFCDVFGNSLAAPTGIYLGTPYFAAADQVTITVPLTVSANTNVSSNYYFKFTFTDLAGNVVHYDNDNDPSTATVGYVVASFQ